MIRKYTMTRKDAISAVKAWIRAWRKGGIYAPNAYTFATLSSFYDDKDDNKAVTVEYQEEDGGLLNIIGVTDVKPGSDIGLVPYSNYVLMLNGYFVFSGDSD